MYLLLNSDSLNTHHVCTCTYIRTCTTKSHKTVNNAAISKRIESCVVYIYVHTCTCVCTYNMYMYMYMHMYMYIHSVLCFQILSICLDSLLEFQKKYRGKHRLITEPFQSYMYMYVELWLNVHVVLFVCVSHDRCC